MNSSISSSEIVRDPDWREWILSFVSIVLVLNLALFGIVILCDPFSTGRLTPITRIDFVGPRSYVNAAHIRDLRFDAAIFGNSHAVRVIPANLTRATDHHFLMLAIEGSWPQEHMFLMRSFDRLRRGRNPVVVLALDEEICLNAKPPGWPGNDLPKWLYEDSTATYLTNILSPYALRMTIQRLKVMAGLEHEESEDGYIFNPTINSNITRLPELFARLQPRDAPPRDAPFPYLDDLEETLGNLDSGGITLLVFMPVYWNQLPVPGSAADERMVACKARAAAVARSAPRGDLLDLQVDGPKVRDRDNFFDPTHFKEPIARDIEAAIAERINVLSKPSLD
jgi:hypothetical protein